MLERNMSAPTVKGNAHIFETKRSLLTGLRPLPLGASVLRSRSLVSGAEVERDRHGMDGGLTTSP